MHIPKGSLFFAPMEGITDEAFRKTILRLYPEWDFLATDFLRVPAAGKYPIKFLIKHFGNDLFGQKEIREKTMFQILTSHKAYTAQMVQDIAQLDVPWMDLNLGCPSPTVCKNGGGSSLLKNLNTLKPLLSTVRENFKGFLSAKVRIGYEDSSEFDNIIKLLNDEGFELITVHGRTRAQMYKEPANWSYIARAVKISQVPVIGNGDVWESDDVRKMFNDTGCHGVMVARGALKSPWMAKDFRCGIKSTPNKMMKEFFSTYRSQLESENITERGLLKQSKSIAKYMANDENQRRALMLSQSVSDFYDLIDQI